MYFFGALNTTSRVSSKFIILITIQTSLTPTQSGRINRSKRKMEECTFDLNFNYYFIMTLNHITTEVAPTHTHTLRTELDLPCRTEECGRTGMGKRRQKHAGICWTLGSGTQGIWKKEARSYFIIINKSLTLTFTEHYLTVLQLWRNLCRTSPLVMSYLSLWDK